MKKLYSLPKRKRWINKRQRNELKKHIKWIKWKKETKKKQIGKSKVESKYDNIVSKAKKVKAPSLFVLRENTEGVLFFIHQLKNLCHQEKNVRIILRDVTKISNGAIAILLSVIREFNEKGLKVSGNKPNHPESRNTLERSGFFNYVLGSIAEENKDSSDSIITKGQKTINQVATAKIVLEAMKTVKGDAIKNKPIQSMLIELMANSVNHAYPSSKNPRWWLSVQHTKEKNEVSFTFVDNGVGILKTLSISQKLKVFFKDEIDIIESAFDGTLGSRTGLDYRGRGLPSILSKFKKKYFTDLVVITNNVFIDYEKNIKKTLKTPFKGTFFYWELNDRCDYGNYN